MSQGSEDNLENGLAALTRWDGGDVQAWRAALAAEGAVSGSGAARDSKPFWNRKLSLWAVAGVAAAILLLAVVPVLHSIGSSLQGQWTNAASLALSDLKADEASRKGADFKPAPAEGRFRYNYDALVGGGRTGSEAAFEGAGAVVADTMGMAVGEGFLANTPAQFRSPSSGDTEVAVRNAQEASPAPNSGRPVPPTDRHVIRKATIELRVADVRAAFLKASHLISEAHGEYVQESSLTGGDQRLEGNLTLRVAADRLSAVLQALRELGVARAETAGGEDVTTQVVDLEARLSNEKRVEVELLQLMEKRADAPLKEVLELRSAIANVRQVIETLTGQRERLSRLVSLATILVIIRPADAVAEPSPPGLWDYFATAISRAAERGVRALINTVAGLILVLVGGAVWIVLMGLAGVVVVRRLRARPAR